MSFLSELKIECDRALVCWNLLDQVPPVLNPQINWLSDGWLAVRIAESQSWQFGADHLGLEDWFGILRGTGRFHGRHCTRTCRETEMCEEQLGRRSLKPLLFAARFSFQ